jgi:hypothetical protein
LPTGARCDCARLRRLMVGMRSVSIQRHVGHEVTAFAQEESPREADGHAPGRPERAPRWPR